MEPGSMRAGLGLRVCSTAGKKWSHLKCGTYMCQIRGSSAVPNTSFRR